MRPTGGFADFLPFPPTALLRPDHPGKAVMSAGVGGDHSVTHSPPHHPSSIIHWAPPERRRAMLPKWKLQASFALTYLQETVRCPKSLSDELILGLTVTRGTPVWGGGFFPISRRGGGHWLQGGRRIFTSLSMLDMLLNIKLLSLKVSFVPKCDISWGGGDWTQSCKI